LVVWRADGWSRGSVQHQVMLALNGTALALVALYFLIRGRDRKDV